MKLLPSFLQKQPAQAQPASVLEIQKIREQILNVILVVASIMGTLAYFSNIFSVIKNEDWATAAVQTALIVLVIGLTVFEHFGYQIRSSALLGALFLLALSDLITDGLPGEGRMFMLVYVTVALVLLPFRQAMLSMTASTLAMSIIAALMVNGVLAPPDFSEFDVTVTGNWITGIFVYLLMAALCLYALYSIIRGLEKGFAEQKNLSGSLEAERANLERSIDQRTAELQKRTEDMEISSRFNQALSQVEYTTDILSAARQCFQEQLGFGDILIYLLNEQQQIMELSLADGEQAAAVKEYQPSLSPSLPGTFAALSIKGDARLMRNTGDDAIYFRGSRVDSMGTAILLPLKKASRVIGFIVLLCGDYREVFGNDMILYQNIADQTAAAIDRSNLLERLQRSLDELKTSNRQATQYSWRNYLKATRRKTSYRFTRDGLETGALEPKEAIEALQAGKMVIAPVETSSDAENKKMISLAVPIVLRDQPLGVINLRMGGSAVPEDMLHLVEAIGNRLALALENARLVEEVQQRAERETAVGTISSRVRSSNDIDGILKTAAQEIGRSLGVSDVIVQLRNE